MTAGVLIALAATGLYLANVWWPDATTSEIPRVSVQPISQIYEPGQSLNSNAAATGNPVPALKSGSSRSGGVTWARLSWAQGDSFATGPLDPGADHWQVRAVFSNSVGSTDSNAATMTLQGSDQIAEAPVASKQRTRTA